MSKTKMKAAAPKPKAPSLPSQPTPPSQQTPTPGPKKARITVILTAGQSFQEDVDDRESQKRLQQILDDGFQVVKGAITYAYPVTSIKEVRVK